MASEQRLLDLIYYIRPLNFHVFKEFFPSGGESIRAIANVGRRTGHISASHLGHVLLGCRLVRLDGRDG